MILNSYSGAKDHMKKLILTIFTLFRLTLSYAQITQVSEMEKIFDYLEDVDSKTLVIFDVDMVLVQPSEPAFQMANMKKFSLISKQMMREVPLEKQMIFLSLMSLSSDPILIDERAPEYIQQIIEKGVPVIALTANLTGRLGAISSLEEWRVASLRKLGIDFSKGAPSQSSLIFDHLDSYRGNYSVYLDGIIFANGKTVSKGEVFLSFLEKIHFSPKKVIFIDDRDENLKNLEVSIQKLDKGIKYQGLHYLGAQNYPSRMISESEFESQWSKLALEAKEMN